MDLDRRLTIRDRLQVPGVACTVCNWFAGDGWQEDDETALYAWQDRAPACEQPWTKPNEREATGS